jgi:sodium transport system permease protein
VINIIYAVIALRWSVAYLNREGALVSSAHEPTLSSRKSENLVRSGLITFGFTWLVFYYFMSTLQADYPFFGLFVSLYVVILGAAFIYLRALKMPIRDTLRLRSANLLGWAGTLPLALGLLLFIHWMIEYQMKFLPMPEEVVKGFENAFFRPELPFIQSLFFFGISPGLCEETLFRGALMGSFMKKMSARKSILLSAALFAFLHFSVYRFLPTFIIGIALGYIVYATGSIFPAMVAHMTYNMAGLHALTSLESGSFDTNWYLLGIPVSVLGYFLLAKSRKASLRNV